MDGELLIERKSKGGMDQSVSNGKKNKCMFVGSSCYVFREDEIWTEGKKLIGNIEKFLE